MKTLRLKKPALGLALTCIFASFDLQAVLTGTYVANFNDNNVNIIDPSTSQVTGTVTVGTNPAALAFDGITGMYVANAFTNIVNVIDTDTIQVVGTVSVGNNPQSLAIDGGTGMYVGSLGGTVVNIINTTTNQVSGTVFVGLNPIALAFDGQTGMYVANLGSDNVNIINTISTQVSGTVTVGLDPQALAFDGVTGMYVANGPSGTVNIINTTNQQVVGTVVVGSLPSSLAFDGITGMYVTNQNSNNVNIIDTSKHQVAGTVSVGVEPKALGLNGTGMYVANGASGTVNVIDITTQQVVGTVGVGMLPFAIPGGLLPTPAPPSSTFVIITTSSDGTAAGTLRDAIAQLNVGGATIGARFEGGIGLISLQSDLSAFTVSDIIIEGTTGAPQQVISGSATTPNSKSFSFPGTASLSDVNFSSSVMGNSGALSLSNMTFDSSIVQNAGQLLVPSGEGLTCINSSFTGSGVVSLIGSVISASGLVNMEQLLNIGATSIAEVSSGATLSLARGLSGTGNMEKKGTGSAILEGVSVLTGDLIITEGGLTVNSTAASVRDVFIKPSGTLRGTGTVTGEVTSQAGTVDPGSSIGTLTITGDYAAEASSSHIFEISPTEQSKLIVNGSVTLENPATASILTEPGFYPLPFSFNVIESTSPITGTLNQVSVSNPFLVAEVTSSSNPSSFITITLNHTPFAPSFTGNAGAVAKCVDQLYNQSGCNTNAVVSALATLPTTSEVKRALLQMQPSAFTSLSVLQENHLLYLNSAVDLHLDGAITRIAQGSQQWNLWASGLGAHTDQESRGDHPGFRANSAGAVIGADKLLGKRSCAGALLGYTYGHLRWRERRGKADSNTAYAGGYGRFATPRFFLNAALLYGYTFYGAFRQIKFGNHQPIKDRAKSGFQGMEGAIHLQTGLDYQQDRFALSPFVEADYMVIHQNRFKEHSAGSLNLKVGSHLADLLSAAAGLKLAYRRIKPDHSFIPYLNLRVIREERFFGDKEKAAFACGCSMGDLKGLYPSRTLFGVQAGMQKMFSERHTLSLQYEGRFASHYTDQSGYLEYSFAWGSAKKAKRRSKGKRSFIHRFFYPEK